METGIRVTLWIHIWISYYKRRLDAPRQEARAPAA